MQAALRLYASPVLATQRPRPSSQSVIEKDNEDRGRNVRMQAFPERSDVGVEPTHRWLHRFLEPLKCRQFRGYGAAQESNLPSVGLPRLTGFEALLRKVHLRAEAGFRPRFSRPDAARCAEIGTNSSTNFGAVSAEAVFETVANMANAGVLVAVRHCVRQPVGMPTALLGLGAAECLLVGGTSDAPRWPRRRRSGRPAPRAARLARRQALDG
jgi:hypothetical protein